MTVKYTVKSSEVIEQCSVIKNDLDEKSEKVAELFTTGEKNITSFINEFMELRTDYHALNGKLVSVYNNQ